VAHYKVPGVAVAVLKNGRVVAAAGFGVREARTHDVVEAGTLLGWFDPPTGGHAAPRSIAIIH